MTDLLHKPWPWHISGILIGLMVPLLLLLGNKHFGISGNLRHICAACFPSGIGFFQYNWKKEIWNFFFVAGVLIGGVIASQLLSNPDPIIVNPALSKELMEYNIADRSSQLPEELFSWESLLTVRGIIMLIGGGFLVGFGTRYAGGCTSGHSIMGISNLQWTSLVATAMFMIGGLLMANFILPHILKL